MPYSRGWFDDPVDLMEHIAYIKNFYYADDEVKAKLYLVAKYIDNPLKLKELEEKWLYGSQNKKDKEQLGLEHLTRHLGGNWT